MNKDGLIYVVIPAVSKQLIDLGFRVETIEKDDKRENGTIFYFKDSKLIKDVLKNEFDYIV